MMHTVYLVQRAREVYEDRPELANLLSDSVVAAYALTPPEVKTLAACLLAGEGGTDAALALVERDGLDPELFESSICSLQRRGLVKVVDGQFDFRPTQERLRVQAPDEVPCRAGEAPECQVVLRSLREAVMMMAVREKTPAAGLGLVYAFVFGREVNGSDWGLLGKLANIFLDPREAALFLLEHAHWPFYDQNPLIELFPKAVALAKKRRPEEAPDPDEQAAERRQSDEASWKLRMRRWLAVGDLQQNLRRIDEHERQGLVWPEQAAADRRQVQLDFARWKKLGRPEL